jgi:hypothetical protein
MRKKHFTRQVGLIVSEDIYAQLIEQTNKEEVTISEWIRDAIDMRLLGEKPNSRDPHIPEINI